MIRKNLRGCFQFVKIAAISSCFIGVISAAKTEVPLFLFSGQSNMVGLGTDASKLTADQKKTVANIKIYLDAEGVQLKKWSTLGPGFGATANQFGPELFFGKILSDSLPGQKIAFIKNAHSGTYLGKKDGGWLSPSSGGPGSLYTEMMTNIDAALKSFNTAYDTTLYTPKWAGFIWLQGEFDGWQAADKVYADAYETNLTNLIKDIRTKTGVADLPIIIPMIDASPKWALAATIRAADVAVRNKLKNVDTMDTKGLPSDQIHYSTPGMVTIGQICAARWLAMKYLKEIPIRVYRTMPEANSIQGSYYLSNRAQFDISGRMVSVKANIRGANQFQRQTPTLMIIDSKGSRVINLRN